jgi:hypothetical protein
MMATMSSASALAGEEEADYEELIPPENFAMIEKGLYRSASLCSTRSD